MAAWWFPSTSAQDEKLWSDINRDVRTEVLLPKWPFVQRTGTVRFCAWDDVLSGDFGRVFRLLCEAHGDTEMSIATFSQGGQREFSGVRKLPIVRLDVAELDDDSYWEAIGADPGPNYAFPIWPGAEIVAATGSTGGWSLWAEVEWEIGVIRTTSLASDLVPPSIATMFTSLDTAIDVYMAQALRTDEVPQRIRDSFHAAFKDAERGRRRDPASDRTSTGL